jgi:hypothetical protein
MVVTRVIAAPGNVVWRVFTDLVDRPRWLSEVDSVELLSMAGEQTRWRETRRVRSGRSVRPVAEELVLTVRERGRHCVVSLAHGQSNELSYLFTPVQIGPHRGATTVTATVIGTPPHGLADRLLNFVVGGLAARTAEGAVRDELDALAAACLTRTSAAA